MNTNQLVTTGIILIGLPLAGTIIAWILMHHAVFNADAPTKKNQLNTLRVLVFSGVICGIIELLLTIFSHIDSLQAITLWTPGILGFAGALLGGILTSKQLSLGFMNHDERYRLSLRYMIISEVMYLAGLAVFIFTSSIV